MSSAKQPLMGKREEQFDYTELLLVALIRQCWSIIKIVTS